MDSLCRANKVVYCKKQVLSDFSDFIRKFTNSFRSLIQTEMSSFQWKNTTTELMISFTVSNHFTSSRSKTLSDPEYAEKLTKEDIDHVEAANKRDLRRFLEADGNQDGQLDIEEFSAFLHPHAHDHMQGGVERKLVSVLIL